jgi:uncharacterized protein
MPGAIELSFRTRLTERLSFHLHFSPDLMEPFNQLASALSPYLLQHADNPVAWMEWGPESLALARRLQRPILLSIGYSACHWCHVMAHESFADENTAGLMNDYFVNIKVDREERPDLDRIYQLAHQLLTGQGGGWPLTVFLDPDSQAPFFAGTYFPPQQRHGLIGFPELLQRIHQVWSTRREELREQHLQVQQALKSIAQPRPADEPLDVQSLTDSLISQLAARFDDRHGGFGTAPKFPQTPLLRLLEALADDEQAGQMLSDTLNAMACFGLRDHLAGGFFRYSVDAAWEIPHFEKMLSDNAQLLGLYARAARRWPRAGHDRVCESLVEWLNDEMLLDGGGFAASLDADTSEGEGAFYLWNPKQFEQALPARLTGLAQARFGLDGPANFEDSHWHLVIAQDLDELTVPGQAREDVRENLNQAEKQLLEARRQRPAPQRDDKMIAGWNGLMIENLAQAGRLLGRADWLELAECCLDVTAVRLFGQEPPRAVWRAGRSAHPATLEDHASVLLACLELLQWRFESRWFNLARRLARRIDQQFIDAESGATFLTPLDHEALLTRPLAYSDDATPSGAGMAALGLLRLGHLCGDAHYLKLADLLLSTAAGDICQSPTAHATLLLASLEATSPPTQVLIGGPGEQADDWHQLLYSTRTLPVYRVRSDHPLEDPPALIESMRTSKKDKAVVCSGSSCRPPVFDKQAMLEVVESADHPVYP